MAIRRSTVATQRPCARTSRRFACALASEAKVKSAGRVEQGIVRVSGHRRLSRAEQLSCQQWSILLRFSRLVVSLQDRRRKRPMRPVGRSEHCI